MKNLKDSIGNQTRDLPACSAVQVQYWGHKNIGRNVKRVSQPAEAFKIIPDYKLWFSPYIANSDQIAKANRLICIRESMVYYKKMHSF